MCEHHFKHSIFFLQRPPFITHSLKSSTLFDSVCGMEEKRLLKERILPSLLPCWNIWFQSLLRSYIPHCLCDTSLLTENMTKDREAPHLRVLSFISNKGFLGKTHSVVLWCVVPQSYALGTAPSEESSGEWEEAISRRWRRGKRTFLCKERIQMATAAQKFIPLKLSITRKVCVYPWACANSEKLVKRYASMYRMLIVACLFTAVVITLSQKWRGEKRFWDRISILSTVSHVINDRHRIFFFLISFLFLALFLLSSYGLSEQFLGFHTDLFIAFWIYHSGFLSGCSKYNTTFLSLKFLFFKKDWHLS